jgi:hypothetical protein
VASPRQPAPRKSEPEEVFVASYEVVACQDPVGVVRADVRYGDPVEQEYADLRLVTFDTGVAQRASRSGPSGPTHRLSQLSSLTPGSDHRSLVPRHPQARHD